MDLLGVVNLKRFVYLIFGITFLLSGLVINFIQFLFYYLLRPFNKYLFRKIDTFLTYCIFSQLVFLEQYWANVKVTLYSKKGNFQNYYGKERAILIMNHSYEIDWLLGWVLCENCSILGNTKTFAKKSLKYIPGLGFAWRSGGSIFLERNWEKDRVIIENKVKELSQYEDPLWLLLAAEGTRFTKEKHEVSKAFAKTHGLPELRYHLTPRTKGFATAIPHIRKSFSAVYNVNVGVKSTDVKPTFGNILLGKQIKADFFVERYPMEELPEDEAGLTVWLQDLYKRKDDLVHCYKTKGIWLDDSTANDCESLPLPRRIYPLLNFLVWSVLITLPLSYYTIKIIVFGSIMHVCTALAVLISFIYILDKLVEETKISKASSYGSQ